MFLLPLNPQDALWVVIKSNQKDLYMSENHAGFSNKRFTHIDFIINKLEMIAKLRHFL